jgi:putative NADH-flavin reductase
MSRLSYLQAKITAGTAVSAEIDLRNHNLVAIAMPAAWTAAAITFLGAPVANDGQVVAAESFNSVVDNTGTEVSITAAATKYIVLTQAMQQMLIGLARVKVVSGNLALNVNQVAAAALTLIVEARD